MEQRERILYLQNKALKGLYPMESLLYNITLWKTLNKVNPANSINNKSNYKSIESFNYNSSSKTLKNINNSLSSDTIYNNNFIRNYDITPLVLPFLKA